MSLISALRTHQRHRARTLLALSAVLSFSLVLQPCALAAPVAVDTSVKLEAYHIANHSASLATLGSDFADIANCASLGAACCDDDGYCGEPDRLKRGTSIQLKDLSSDIPALLPRAWSTTDGKCQRASNGVAPNRAAIPAAVPLNVRLCVYLK